MILNCTKCGRLLAHGSMGYKHCSCIIKDEKLEIKELDSDFQVCHDWLNKAAMPKNMKLQIVNEIKKGTINRIIQIFNDAPNSESMDSIFNRIKTEFNMENK